MSTWSLPLYDGMGRSFVLEWHIFLPSLCFSFLPSSACLSLIFMFVRCNVFVPYVPKVSLGMKTHPFTGSVFDNGKHVKKFMFQTVVSLFVCLVADVVAILLRCSCTLS